MEGATTGEIELESSSGLQLPDGGDESSTAADGVDEPSSTGSDDGAGDGSTGSSTSVGSGMGGGNVPCAGMITESYGHRLCPAGEWIDYTWTSWACDDGSFVEVADAESTGLPCDPSYGCTGSADCYDCCDQAAVDDAQYTECAAVAC